MILAHAVRAAPGLRAAVQRKNLDRIIRDETAEAKRIQAQTGCSWSEALRLAHGKVKA